MRNKVEQKRLKFIKYIPCIAIGQPETLRLLKTYSIENMVK